MSELENQVIANMYANGFNPLVPAEVRRYWEERLS
jgi:hypothetical protein